MFIKMNKFTNKNHCIIPRLHDRANIEQTSSKCIQNTRSNCSTSARCLLAYPASSTMVISMLIRKAGGL